MVFSKNRVRKTLTLFITSYLSEQFCSLARRGQILKTECASAHEYFKIWPQRRQRAKGPLKLVGSYVLYESHHVTGVTVLIVVPANQLDECVVQGNTGFGVKD